MGALNVYRFRNIIFLLLSLEKILRNAINVERIASLLLLRVSILFGTKRLSCFNPHRICRVCVVFYFIISLNGLIYAIHTLDILTLPNIENIAAKFFSENAPCTRPSISRNSFSLLVIFRLSREG